MAQLASVATVRDHVDRLLADALQAWQQLPQVAEQFDGWDTVDQVRFIEEWPLREQRLRSLEALRRGGAMSAAQQLAFERLRQAVREKRPIIEHLLQSA